MQSILLFLEKSRKGQPGTLVTVTLFSLVIGLLFNLLFLIPAFEAMAANKLLLLGIGVVVYAVWIGTVLYLLKRDGFTLTELGITRDKAVKGARISLYVFVVVNMILIVSSLVNKRPLIRTEHFNSYVELFQTVVIFNLNTLPGAFIEELVFRVFLISQLYLLLKHKIVSPGLRLLVVLILSQFLFAIVHIPMLAFRHDYNMMHIVAALKNLFISGINFALIYLLVRNIFVVTFLHAVSNYSLAMIDSPMNFTILFMLLLLVVGIAHTWGHKFRLASDE
jgi:membrane protease YdiL (CAAX protease family)